MTREQLRLDGTAEPVPVLRPVSGPRPEQGLLFDPSRRAESREIEEEAQAILPGFET